MTGGRFFKTSRERQELVRARLREEGIGAPAAPAIPRRQGDGPSRLSFSQQRLWFLDRLEPGSPAYNIPGGLCLRGRLEVPALAASLGEIVRRHEVLRTVFVAEDGRPLQVALPPAPFLLPAVDLSALPKAVREAETRRLAREEARRPFDLGSGPLLRAALLRLAGEETADDHVLVFNMHHIVSDGWSMGVLIRELGALYGAFIRRLPSPLAPLPIQYADFAEWQRQWLEDGVLAEQLAYWRDRLAGVPVLEMPLDHPRPALQSPRVAALDLFLPPAVGLEDHARRHGATPFMALLALFQAVLRRHAGQEDIAVGTPVANRRRAEVEGLIGFFVNTLVLRVDLPGDPTFAELLERVREVGFGAFAHQDVPFEKLVEELRPERDPSRPPLFQAMLTLQNAPTAPPDIGGLVLEALPAEAAAAKFDLTLILWQSGAGYAGALEYTPDLFEAATMARLAGHLAGLAAGITEGLRLSELPLLSTAERQQLAVEWTDTASLREEPWLVPERIAGQAAARPDAVAVVWEGESLTYGELWARSGRLARRLRELGVSRDVRIALCLERSPALAVAITGVFASGGAWVPLDPAYPEDRLAFMLEDSGAAFLITQRTLLPRVPQGAEVLFLEDLLELLDEASPITVEPDGLAYVIYTSGSTGRPKGVMVEHRGLARVLDSFLRRFGYEAGDVQVSVSSFSFDAILLELVTSLMAGGTCVLAPLSPLEPRRLAALLAGATRVLAVPSLMRRLLEELEPAGLYRSLRTVFLGGEAAPLDLLEQVGRAFPRADVAVLYGPTEGTILCTTYLVAAGESPRRSLLGRPLPDMDLHLLDRHGSRVPIGVAGEIWIGGAGVTRGYLGRPELTAERYPEVEGRRLYRTGDLARWTADGQLEFLGRVDEQVKLRGFRIEPGEIEAALLTHPAVREAAVMVREDAPGDRRLVAYLVAAAPVPTAEALRVFLGALLPEAMVPSAFVFLDVMPLTPSAKLDRRALPAPERGREGGTVAPRDPFEEVLLGIWAEVLGIPPGKIGIHDDFFALGGHSLLAAQVAARTRSAFGFDLAVRSLFTAPTVAALAREVERGVAEGWGEEALPLLPVPRDGEAPLSFAQQRLWLLDQIDPGSPLYSLPFALRLTGRLAVAALAWSLEETVRRHESLRTVFPDRGGHPVQVLLDDWRPDLPVVDLDDGPGAAAEVERVAMAEAGRGFDLSRGPLLRATLLRTGAEEHVLLLTLHHIVADGWSIGVLVREVAALYEAALRGERSPLPALPIQYADFAAWQRRRLSGEVLERQLAWWRQRLAGVPSIDLPLDRPRTAAGRGNPGASRPLLLPDGLAAGLSALARGHGATLFMTLLAAFEALLGRHTGQQDFAVGTPVSGRGRQELEGLIGFFVDTLVLRSDLAGDPSFSGLLARVRETTLDAFARQEVPFDRIVEELQPERVLDRQPLFQVLLALHNLPEQPIVLPGLILAPVEAATGTSKFELSLAFLPISGLGADGLAVACEYRTDLFDAATIDRLLEHLRTLLAGIVEHPERRLSGLPLLPESELRLLSGWGGERDAFPVDACLHELFAARAAAEPRARAVTLGVDELTYGELDRRANRLAHHLLRLGAGPEVVVAVCLERRSPDLVTALLAVLKAGAAYLPIDPDYPPERRALMLDDSGAPLLLTTGPLAGAFPPHGARPVLLDEPAAWTGESGEAPRAGAVPENLAYVIYTSGSTGRPKGVAVTHANAVRLFAATRERFGFGPGDVWTLFHSYAFDFSVWEIWGALLHGGRLVIVPHQVSRSPEDFLRLLEAEGVTVLNQTPSAFRQLVWAEESQPSRLALRLVVFGGEALDVAALAPWIERHGDRRPELVNMYGITETTVHVTLRRISGRDLGSPGSPGSPIGRPLDDLAVHLLDAAGVRVPVGVPGEIHVGGAGLARGYLGRPELTAGRFVPDPFAGSPGARLYRSGDLARWRPDGELEYLGRIDHQVKVRGFRIELGEIEAALMACPGVREAVVLAREAAGGDRRLVAWVVFQGALDPGEIRERLRETLPDYMVPAAVVALDALPLTPHGKVDRKALPEPGEDREAAALELRTPMEKVVAAVWAEVLGRDGVGAGDDFFALGGHSLLATRAVARLREVLGTGLRVLDLFEEPTVAGLARRLEARHLEAAPEAPPLEPAPRHLHPEGLPLSFAQQRLWFLDRLDPGSPAYNIPSTVRLRGALDSGALERAWSALVHRHETLRTVFGAVDGRPVQKILPPGREHLPRVDLTALAPAAREAESHRLVEAAALTAFDLARGPLQKVLLLRLAAEEHLFVLVQHHVVSDGWSAGVLLREMAELYRGSLLPPLAIQYADFAWWQQQWLQGEVLEERLAYWRRELSGGDLPALALPTDRPRPGGTAVQTFTGARESLSLPAELSRAVHALGNAEGATLFMVLLAAFQTVLGRWAGQEDVVVGSPIAGRDQPETQGLIGFFVNTLVLRGDLAGGPSFRELLRRTRRTVLGAFAHQDLPFETLVEALRPERDLARTPLFQAFFNLLNFTAERIELPGLTLEAGAAEAAPSKFDLTLYAAEDEDRIHLSVVYDANLFTTARMAELLAQLQRLLAGGTADPDIPVHRLSLITPEARRVLPDPTVALITSQAGRVRRSLLTPTRPALLDREGAWTYEELDLLANRLAHRLRAGGIAPGDRVAIWAHRGASLAWAVLGTLEAGAAFVLLDPAYPPPRLVDRLRLAAPRAWLSLTAAGAPPPEIAEALTGIAPDLRLDLPSSLAEARSAVTGWPTGSPGGEVGPGDLAYVAFTSGSTGTPKGILGDHGPLSHFLDWQAATFGLGEDDRFALLGGLSHDPLLRDLFAPLSLGATLCVPEPESLLDGRRLAAWLAESRVTVLHFTPALGRLLAAAEPRCLPALRWAFFGGDVLTREDVESLRRLAPAVTCVNFYGATETPQAMGWYPVPADGGETHRLPLGWGIDGVQLLVVNDAGEPAGVGELGEIWIRTPYLARGYLGDPELTRQRFVTNPWRAGDPVDRLYRTGDLGRHLPDGAVAFAGRIDDQVKIRGFRVEPGEVEAALSRHAAVRECAVVARQGSDGEQRLVAYVAPAGESGLEAELREILRSQLPAYSVPSAFVLLDALPRNVHGKLDRRALPEPRPSRTALSVDGEPRTPAEEVLAGIWRDVLGVQRVGPADDFFALGGHSLRAVQVTARAGDAFGVELPVRALFEAPTLGRLAHRVEDLLRQGSGLALPPLVPLPRDGRDLPLSFAQTRLWFLDRLEGAGPAYNMPAAVRLTGPLDVPALARTLGEVVRRHEVLRTSYPTVDGRPALRVAPPAPVPLPLVDLAALPGALREAEAGSLVRQEAARPFDLGLGPLLRAGLLRLSPEEHVLLLTLHHIVSDGWSMGVLVEEVSALYPASALLPPLPLQYADYAAWQRSWLHGEALERLLAFWRERLAGVPPVLELPTDRPRPAVRGSRGGRRPLALPLETAQGARALAGRSGATLFMVLLAAFEAWLHRLTGQERFVVGTPVAGRDRAELEPLVGFFANTLALPADVDEDSAFTSLLARVRETALAAYAHQQMPFEKLVDELELPRSLGHTPLFQVMLALQGTPRPARAERPGPGMEVLSVDSGTAKFDWTLFAVDANPQIPGALEYSADLFDGATVDRFLGAFRTLLAAAVADPALRLSGLPLLSGPERHQLLADWNDTAAPLGAEPFLHRRFMVQAARSPHVVALCWPGGRLTFKELARRAGDLARCLREQGVGPEVVVGLRLDRSPELVVAALAVLEAGGAYLPLDPAHPEERHALLLADAGAPLVITRGPWPAAPAGTKVLPIDADVAPRANRDVGEGLAPSREGASPSPTDSLAYVIYTSGSTGRPKGVMVQHGALARYLDWCVRAYEVEAGRGAPVHSSLAFDLTVTSLFAPLLAGRAVTLLPEGEGVEALAAAVRPGARYSLVKLTPAHLDLLAQQVPAADVAGWTRTLVVGGEALRGESLAFWRRHAPETRIVNEYGPTETVVGCCVHEVREGDLPAGPVPIGRPIAGARLQVLDRRLQPVPAGVPGELFIGGEGVTRGYRGRPAETAASFLPDPFSAEPGARLYRSGDLARRRPDGLLEYLGRADGQLKIRGFRIEPGEVEAALLRHPAVREAAVGAVEEGPGRRRLVAWLSASGPAPTVGELREHLGRILPEPMVPALFVVLDSLPLTPNGKVDRRALPRPEGDRPELARSYVAPRTPAEGRLAAIWAEVLGLDRAGVHDNFFELGGDSILSIQIVSRARQAGLVLVPRQVFQHQTIAELAAVAGTVAVMEAEQGPVTGPAPLTPIQRWFFAAEPPESHHWNQALLLGSAEPLSAAALAAAVLRLAHHHDALRLRFRRGERGEVRQEIAPPHPLAVPFAVVDLSALPGLEEAAARVQASLDLAAGPIARFVGFDLGAGITRLLVVIHHLAVDGVSWRVLLEDLETLYGGFALPAKTTSFKAWAERLAESEAAEEELQGSAPPLPVDFEGGEDTEGRVRMAAVELDAEETRALLQEVPAAYNSQVNDALLAALARAVVPWAGGTALSVDLEGHGREEIFPDVDLSRTVGWFTTISPVCLELAPGDGPGETLMAVKEALRAVPSRGWGGQRSSIAFNYLGRFDAVLSGASPFRIAEEDPGPTRSPRAPRRYRLEVSGAVAGGRLRVTWRYGAEVYRPETVERLAAAFAAELRSLVAHCRSLERCVYTPSDFPAAGLGAGALRRVLAELAPVLPAGRERWIESLDPLAPAQEGMLFETLRDGVQGGSGLHVEQLALAWRGDLDPAAFESAWRRLLERHAMLRTAFLWRDQARPLQAVLRRVDLPLLRDDWRAFSPTEQEERLTRYLIDERRRGFDPSRPPLLRLALIRTGDDVHQLVWTHHHLLMDGWCRALLLDELVACYRAFAGGREPALPPARPYRDYVAWLGRQDLTAADAFWAGQLQDLTHPTPLGRRKDGSMAGALGLRGRWRRPDGRGEGEDRTGRTGASLHPFDATPGGGVETPQSDLHERTGSTDGGASPDFSTASPDEADRWTEREVHLSPADTATLQALARSHRLTLSTVVQGAWASLLGRYAGTGDVVFGITVSGRPADLPGIESTVGLFIHTVPLRARLQPAAPFWSWLRDLQELSSELRRYETTPADRIRERSGVPATLPLYESLLVFENYPGRPASTEDAGPALQAEVAGARSFGARTGVPLTLLVFPGETLALRVIADAGRLDPEDADRVALHLASLLRAVATEAEPSLAALQENIPESELPHVQPLTASPDATPYVAPRTPLEQAVAALWAEVLGVPRAGIHDGFFTLGGHSLLAARLVAGLRHAFQVDLPLRALFESPTVAELAAEIAARKGTGELPAAWPEIVPDPAARHLPFPLTDVQQAYWIGRGGAFELGNVATHLYFEVESRVLDPGRFQTAWQRLVERHDMLRAVVLPDGTQQILPEVPPYEIALLDLRQLPPAEAGRELLALRERMSHQVLPADRWPLFDIHASLLPAGRVRLHFSLDLLIGDAWSWRLLAAELAGLYAGPEAELPPLSLSFRDYVLGAEGLRGTPPYQRALDYWRERLADLPPAPELPLAKSPGSVDAPRFVRRSARLEPAEWSRLKARAARSGLTPSGVLLAAFAEVLGTWSKSPRFTLNLTLFNRLPLHPEVDRIVGDFTSLTLLAIDPPAGGFEARARRLQERLWADLDHRLVSGVEVMRELGRSQEAARGAATMPVVFTSTLALGTPDPEEAETEEGDEPLEVVYTVGQTPQVWLDHQVMERGGTLVVNWDAVEELFPAGMLDAMVEAHHRLLGWLAAGDWSWREDGRSLLPASQLALIAAVNDTAVDVAPPETLLHGGFLEQARRQPHRPAVISKHRTLTYGELRRRSGWLAHRLRELGAGPGRLVAVSMEKGWEQVVATLAILEAGAAYLPVDPGLPLERRRYLCEQGGVEVALTQPWLDRDLEWPGDLQRIVVEAEPAIGAMEEPPPLPGPRPDDLAYVLYTSGSTGQPKGVVIDHRGAVNTIADINRRFAVGPDDRVLALSSLSFDLSVYDLFGLLAAGGAIVFPEPEAARDPARWAELMEAHRVTLWNTVPALLEMLVEHKESSLPLSRGGGEGRRERGPGGEGLRLVLLSGDWIPVSLPDRLRSLAGEEVQVVSLGGATEASIWSIFYPIERVDPLWRSIPYGRPLANQAFHVLDGELAPRPVWVPGELYIGGDGVALGYWGDEERTRASFLRHPRTGERLYRTGDLGRFLPGGDIEFLGREDFQVKIQGFRIELGEIETALLRHPSLSAAAVVAEGPARGARRLVAFVVPAEGAVPDPGELRRFVADHLPDYMVPAAILPLDRLPLTSNGKVDRSALARLAALPEAVTPSSRTTPRNPRRPIEEVVAGVWAELLGIERLGVHDDVFALGGQSLLATQAASRLARSFGMEVPLRHLFEAPTVAELAERVEALRRAATGTAPPPLLPTFRTDRADLPLSFAQERLWFLEQLEPGTAVHHIASAVRLTGALDPAALAAALAGVAARHESLRTTFHSIAEEGGTPVQRVAPPAAEQPLPLIDLRALSGESEALRLVRAEPLRLFDLSQGPLWRTTLVRTGEEEHILLVTLHHIVADGWSIAVLIGEVAALYRAAVTGEPAPLPPLPVQYADYARWQRHWLRGEALDAHLAWWKERLGGSLPVLELPADHPRPAVRGHRGGQVRSLLPPDLSRGLERLARREGVTLYMTLLAGFQTLLARWTGQTDLLTGFPIAGRNRAETEGLVGLFVNTLVIRTGLAGDPAFAAVLARVREEALGAYDHQDLPFEKLVEELNPERSLSHTAVFQILFSLQSTPPAAPAGVPGLALGFLPQETAAAKFDLTLNLTETAEGIAGSWIYNADLFEPATVQRMAGHFERLLGGAVADPCTRISRLPLLSEAEAQQILVEVNDSASPFDGNLPVHRLFARHAECAPDAVAAVFEDELLTYGELRRRSRQLAHHLQALGVGPDVPVGILLPPSLHLVVGILGILEAGGGYVGLDPAQPAERLAFQLADSGAPVLVTEKAILTALGVEGLDTDLGPQGVVVPPPLGGWAVGSGGGQEGGSSGLGLEGKETRRGAETEETRRLGRRQNSPPPDLPHSLPRPLPGGEAPPPEERRYSGAVWPLEVVRLDADWPVIAAAAPETMDTAVPDDVSLDSLAYVIYTSGSTGRPKGVANRHRQLLAYLHAMVERLQPPADSRWTMHQTLAVDAPITQLYVALCRGGVLHVLPLERATDGAALAEYLARHPIDYLKIAPSHLAALQAGMDARDLLPLRLVMLGGEGLSRDWAEPLQAVAPPGCVILNHYGPTETTCGVLTCRVTEGPFPFSGATVPLGRPLPNARIYVLDAALEPVPFGVPGELHIGGPSVSSGYLGRPELTAERFVPDPFGDGHGGSGGRLYRTGDLVRLLPDGRFEFLGRIDHQIKVRGYRVELEEIEAILAEHPGVRTALVLADLVEGADGEDVRLVACVVPEAAAEPAPAELRRYLRQRLPEYMVPGVYLLLDSMPRGPQGKVDRKALSRLAFDAVATGAGQVEAPPRVPPRSAAERVVAGLWAEVLGRDPAAVGVRDPFFDVGGHSLLATRLAARLRQAFRVELPLRAVFERPTIEGLVETLVRVWGDAGVVEEIAETFLELASLSEDEVREMLAGERE